MNFKTLLIHAGRDRDPYTGASSIPIYQTSTFAQEDPEHLGRYDYARSDNPTREALEETMAALEGGSGGLAFASGMAAISSAFLLFRPGDHLVVGDAVYGGTYRVLTGLFRQWQLDVTFVNTQEPEAVRRAIRTSTRAIFVETPANPLLQITDLRAIAAIAGERDLVSIVDNTFMSPFLQRPIECGFDIVVHSATKFLGGHSDLIAGVVVAKDAAMARRLKTIQNSFGGILGPQDSWLTLRGIKTLGVRMEAQQESAGTIAQWLREQPAVRRVYYPGLPGHPGRDIHFGQASGAGAVVSFELANRSAAVALLKRVRLPLVAVSLGGVESILSYPATMSHAALPREERQARGISDGLVRLSVGLEDAGDIIADLSQALDGGTSCRARSLRKRRIVGFVRIPDHGAVELRTLTGIDIHLMAPIAGGPPIGKAQVDERSFSVPVGHVFARHVGVFKGSDFPKDHHVRRLLDMVDHKAIGVSVATSRLVMIQPQIIGVREERILVLIKAGR
jgi:cysteine-S-conjugate beta-lyase